MEEFITIEENSETLAELIEKKSKFIATLYYVDSTIKANQLIRDIKKKYYDSRHNCIAYRILENDKLIEKYSDDGEPSGTAGAPIITILRKNNLCNVLIIVTRYFGGILLGTGGLVSCYSGVTLKVLEKAPKITKCIGVVSKIKISYSNFENFKYYCKIQNININNIEYLDKIICEIEAEKCKIDKIMQDIKLKKLIIEEIVILNKKFISKSI